MKPIRVALLCLIVAIGIVIPQAQLSANENNPFTDGHPDLVEAPRLPTQTAEGGWRGIFRINCDFSHSSYNDPIVFPNQENAAHLHRFYGAEGVDHATNFGSLLSAQYSTCQGNTLNLSSYWVPALLAPEYDRRTRTQVIDENGEPAWKVVPAVVGDAKTSHEVFYYSAGVDDLDSIQPIPDGLMMVAGTASTMPGQEQDSSVVRWHCQSWQSNDANNPRWSADIPVCFAPDRLRMDIFFPSCWDGVNLDSWDHKSHMAYPERIDREVQCPSSHPVPIVRVSYHYAFGVTPQYTHPDKRSTEGWRLSSDMYDTDAFAGGLSLHADWMNGWNPVVMEAILENCIKAQLDCHDGNLANGYSLSSTQQGTGYEPEIINGGLGHSHHH